MLFDGPCIYMDHQQRCLECLMYGQTAALSRRLPEVVERALWFLGT